MELIFVKAIQQKSDLVQHIDNKLGKIDTLIFVFTVNENRI